MVAEEAPRLQNNNFKGNKAARSLHIVVIILVVSVVFVALRLILYYSLISSLTMHLLTINHGFFSSLTMWNELYFVKVDKCKKTNKKKHTCNLLLMSFLFTLTVIACNYKLICL